MGIQHGQISFANRDGASISGRAIHSPNTTFKLHQWILSDAPEAGELLL